jgi:DNA-binding winged helix-turn-helix (wHTH) protein
VVDSSFGSVLAKVWGLDVQTHPDTVYQFGQFEVSAASGELLRDGKHVKLQEQPFRLLVVLLENAGDVVTREELRDRIWPKDTFVDFDGSLRVAIRKLREALHDDVDYPRYVETIPKRGYRFLGSVERSVSPSLPGTLPRREDGFIGELETPVQDVVPVVTVEPDRGSRPRQAWLKIAAGVLAISVVALVALVAYRWHRQQRPQEQEALTAVPFTALPGLASSPAFSPDGSRIAFAWNGDPAHRIDGFDLYVKALGSETLLRLTQHPSEWISPAWSPDGTQIAFHRLDSADTGIYVVPALGGPERKLRSTRIYRSDFAIISWSPDGKWIAFADRLPSEEHARIYLLSTETLETSRLL